MPCKTCKHARQSYIIDMCGCVKFLQLNQTKKYIELFEKFKTDQAQTSFVSINTKYDDEKLLDVNSDDIVDGIIVFDKEYECEYYEK